jgi:hypothetical protein
MGMGNAFGTGSYGMNFCLPRLDQALSALLTDLKDRGMLDDTLVVAVGEFGRTPVILTSEQSRDPAGSPRHRPPRPRRAAERHEQKHRHHPPAILHGQAGHGAVRVGRPSLVLTDSRLPEIIREARAAIRTRQVP